MIEWNKHKHSLTTTPVWSGRLRQRLKMSNRREGQKQLPGFTATSAPDRPECQFSSSPQNTRPPSLDLFPLETKGVKISSLVWTRRNGRGMKKKMFSNLAGLLWTWSEKEIRERQRKRGKREVERQVEISRVRREREGGREGWKWGRSKEAWRGRRVCLRGEEIVGKLLDEIMGS